jgi:predicted transcriptional regulator
MNTTLVTLSEIGFVFLTVVYISLLVLALKKGLATVPWDPSKKSRFLRQVVISLVAWFVIVAAWSSTGMMASFDIFPLNFMPVIVVPLAAIIVWVSFSQNLRDVLHQISPSTILYLQSFRVFVEITLWMLFVAHAVPEQMTFEGRNFDILVGLTGPVMAVLVARNRVSKTGLIIWNIAGLCLLINIVTIAILSTPTPVRMFMNEPSNTIVAYFPSSLLPAFLVPLAYTLHFFSLKQALAWKSLKKYHVDPA